MAMVSCGLGSPLTCIGAFVMAISEGPTADGDIGQRWFQPVLFLFFGVLSFGCFALLILLLSVHGRREVSPRVHYLVRLASIPLFVGAAALAGGALSRLIDREWNEGAAALLIAVVLFWPGLVLLRTRREEFQPPAGSGAPSPYPRPPQE